MKPRTTLVPRDLASCLHGKHVLPTYAVLTERGHMAGMVARDCGCVIPAHKGRWVAWTFGGALNPTTYATQREALATIPR